MIHIKNVAALKDYQLEVLLDNGSSITLNMASRLGTARFGMLQDGRFFEQVCTDGHFIRWGNQVEISLNELFQLVQK